MHAGTNSGKLKVDSMIFMWTWSKMVMAFWFVRPWNLLYLYNKTMNWNLWIELIFWMLIVMQIFFVRQISYPFTFNCWGSTAVAHLVKSFGHFFGPFCPKNLKWRFFPKKPFKSILSIKTKTSKQDFLRKKNHLSQF